MHNINKAYLFLVCCVGCCSFVSWAFIGSTSTLLIKRQHRHHNFNIESDQVLSNPYTTCTTKIIKNSQKSIQIGHTQISIHKCNNNDDINNGNKQMRTKSILKIIASRLNTIEAAGFLKTDKVMTASIFGNVKKLHNPITYIILSLLAGFKWSWCFKSPLYWFGFGFCIKWYRARYVFKIPVWDRQPNWNNIITNKEQEKDLKAYTCKNCGSTIFIAKTREFFFEGDTGFGGLGCFSCGAKGKDNFIMDRERIIDDVGDMDDYFEYESPLDFVSRAERRKLLKETQGDEAKANQILLERTGSSTTVVVTPESDTSDETKSTDNVVDSVIDNSDEPEGQNEVREINNEIIPTSESSVEEPERINEEISSNDDSMNESTIVEKKSTKKKKKKTDPVKPSGSDAIDLDALDMDAF